MDMWFWALGSAGRAEYAPNGFVHELVRFIRFSFEALFTLGNCLGQHRDDFLSFSVVLRKSPTTFCYQANPCQRWLN